MLVIDFLSSIFHPDQVQIFYFELAFWCTLCIVTLFILYRWREGTFYEKPTRIDGKVVIVTGCNTGMGKEIALELAKRGGRIYMACRNYAKCEKARREIINLSGNINVFNSTLDLASFKSVREFVKKFNSQEQRLDILINNACVFATPPTVTVDGFESQFAVNHLGHFLLTNLLLDKLKSSAPSRIVVVSSIFHLFGRINKENISSTKNYNRVGAYCHSKLANVLFTRKLATMLKDSNVTANCLHPGMVHSEVTRYIPWLSFMNSIFSWFVLRSTKGGAQPALKLALDPELSTTTGKYFDCMEMMPLVHKARDEHMANWLWQQSEIMTKLGIDN